MSGEKEKRRRPGLHGVWWLFLYALLGFCAGLTNGLLGAAGGILLVSVLPHMPLPPLMPGGGSGQTVKAVADPRDVFATALAVMMPVSVVSLWRYMRSGWLPDARSMAMILLPAALGGLVGAWLLDRLSPRRLRLIFSGLILLSGVWMIL